MRRDEFGAMAGNGTGRWPLVVILPGCLESVCSVQRGHVRARALQPNQVLLRRHARQDQSSSSISGHGVSCIIFSSRRRQGEDFDILSGSVFFLGLEPPRVCPIDVLRLPEGETSASESLQRIAPTLWRRSTGPRVDVPAGVPVCELGPS